MKNWAKLKMTSADTAEKLYEQCQKLFPCWKSDNINLSKIKSDRTGDYTIEFSPNIEADEQWKNISADDLPKNKQFITLEERMKLEIQYFKATKNHLDVINWTLCAGSRDSDGGVPDCSMSVGKFRVCWFDSGYSFGDLRARSAVSLDTSSDTLLVGGLKCPHCGEKLNVMIK